MAEHITREEMKDALQASAITLVEALPEKYYNDGHLPGAVQMNHDEVVAKADILLPDKAALIVTYCASETCPNSGYVADQLIARGYTNVKKYVGGKRDWEEAGEKFEQKSTPTNVT
tara:strand:+ start:287 stop:634 length:348 start_codon:yes stop_codon:yes gene_type:complete